MQIIRHLEMQYISFGGVRPKLTLESIARVPLKPAKCQVFPAIRTADSQRQTEDKAIVHDDAQGSRISITAWLAYCTHIYLGQIRAWDRLRPFRQVLLPPEITLFTPTGSVEVVS